MRTLIATVAALALVLMATPVQAHDFGVAGYYVAPHPGHSAGDPVGWAGDAQVWKETNGIEGLQKVNVYDESGKLVAFADERVA